MKPDAASLPPVLILASGFLLLFAIAALAANPDLLRPASDPAPPEGPDPCAPAAADHAGAAPPTSPPPPCETAPRPDVA